MEPLSVYEGSLNTAVERYLNSGPLRVEGRWQIVEEVSTIVFQERDARLVALEGTDVEGGAPLHTRIIATSANNTFVYLFITTVPVERRSVLEPTLEAMLETIEILE
jgi:hypothetical protein